MPVRKLILLAFAAVVSVIILLGSIYGTICYEITLREIRKANEEMAEDMSNTLKDASEELFLKGRLTRSVSFISSRLDGVVFRTGYALARLEKKYWEGIDKDHSQDENHTHSTINTGAAGVEGIVNTKVNIYDESDVSSEEMLNIFDGSGGSSEEIRRRLCGISGLVELMETTVEINPYVEDLILYDMLDYSVVINGLDKEVQNNKNTLHRSFREFVELYYEEIEEDINDEWGDNILFDYDRNDQNGAPYKEFIMIRVLRGDDGEIKAFLCAHLGIGRFFEEIMTSMSGWGGSTALVDYYNTVFCSNRYEGQLMVRMDDEYLYINENCPELVEFFDKVRKEGEYQGIIDIDGIPCMMAGKVFGDAGSFLAVQAYSMDEIHSEGEAFKEMFVEKSSEKYQSIIKGLSQGEEVGMIIVVIAIIFSGILSLGLSEKIARPLARLTDKVEKIDLDTLEFEPDRKGTRETVALGAVFEELVKTLKVHIENLEIATASREKIQAEIDLAGRIQEHALPNVFPPFPERPELDIYAIMEPAREVGGDFYDIFMIGDHQLVLVIADVSGKGIPAAMFMMKSKFLIKQYAMSLDDPAAVFETVNRQLCENNEDMMFVTAFIVMVDLSTGEARYCNAGHEMPAVRRKGGSYEYLRVDPEVILGVVEDVTFKTGTFSLGRGDALLLITDGAIDEENAAGEFYGRERLIETARRIDGGQDPDSGSVSREFLEELFDDIRVHVGDKEQFDDITMLCFNYL